MAKLMSVQDWIPENPYPEPIFLLTPFTLGINGLSKIVRQRQRERERSVCGASGGNVSNSEENQIQAKSHSRPHPPVGSN